MRHVTKEELVLRCLRGIKSLANCVGITMGFNGGNVIYNFSDQEFGITKDGATVADNFVITRDAVAHSMSTLVKEASKQTNIEAGDGCQPLHAKILTPTGWVKMGDIKVGDTICGTNGTTQVVEAIYNKGERKIYKITFEHGQEVECCGHHIWTVYDDSQKNKIVNLSTQELIDSGLSVECGQQGNNFRFSTPNTYTNTRSDVKIANPFNFGVKSITETQELPKTIVFAEANTRRLILDGVIYGDSNKVSLDKELQGTIIHAPNEAYAMVLLDLARSLGIPATLVNEHFVDNKKVYHVQLHPVTDRVKIVNIEFTGRTETVQCIKVSNEDSLYITDDYIVTHNTTTSCVLAGRLFEMGLKAIGKYPKDNIITNLVSEEAVSPTKNILSLDLGAYKYLELDKNEYGKTDFTIREFGDKLTQYVDEALKYLDTLKTKINLTPSEIVYNIALTSSNGDARMAKIFSDAFELINHKGTVVSKTSIIADKDTVELVEGFSFNGAVLNKAFLDQNTATTKLIDPIIFLTDERIDDVDDISNVVRMSQSLNRPFLLVCGAIGNDMLARLVNTMIQNNILGAVVQAPRFGEIRDMYMDDIAILTGGTYLARKNIRLKNAKVEHVGTAEKVLLSLDGTKILGFKGDKDAIQERIETLKNFNGSAQERKIRSIDERLVNLAGKFAQITYKVDSEVENTEAEYRLEDTLHAIQGALSEGVLAGGGVSLLLCAKRLADREEFKDIAPYMTQVLEAPFRKLLENSELDPEKYLKVIYEQISEDNLIGVELKSAQLVNMIEANVLDPLKVTKSALKSAASVINTVLQTKLLMVTE